MKPLKPKGIMIDVISCGTKAKTKLHSIEGVITAIIIRFGRVNYEFSYFSNMEYKNVWLDECEFEITEKTKTKIGFKK